MRRSIILFAVAVLCSVCFAGSAIVNPFEVGSQYAAYNEIDNLVVAALKKKKIAPANLCSDHVFIRRVYLDVTGALPSPQQVRKFLASTDAAKRAKLIDALLTSEEFAGYYSLKWCDLLRVKAEFPINLWPNAVQAYHRWITGAVEKNMPYDRFARELLTSSGSNFRVPQVNFYRAMQGHNRSSIASVAALTFMGVRLEKWPENKRSEMEAFFSRIAFKGTAEWKEEIVYLDPAVTDQLKAVFPDGKTVTIAPDKDPRKVFADWLTESKNPWFARNGVNRIWAWLFGRGIIHQPDDIRPDNPPSNPELLVFLEKEFVKAKYDTRHIFRLILNSRTYQQSSIMQTDNPQAEALFAYYPVRRLGAEVLIDALCFITGSSERYSSAIPEPFSFIPKVNRSVDLADGSTTSQFLEMFGRPARDTGLFSERNNKPTDTQRLHMLNSTHIQKKIESSGKIKQYVKASKKNHKRLIRLIYSSVLSRYPTRDENAIALKYFQNNKKINEATNDLVWALINTKEFLYRH
ncbi:MAG: DUF1553 domain-containing protein [Planctomycetes bacterium]|nr:DUF1553 domain-containing protein [Planctomycetota bacterium]